jgi:RNA polymerase sigma-70 factor (ECF subfamily)
MFHIARNVGLDHYRKHPPESLLPEEGAFALHSHTPLPGHGLDRQQQNTLLECALFQLPPEKREVLVLSRYQDMKYEQIAELLGCEVGAVKVRVHRALKELREIFFKLSSEKMPCDAKKSVKSLRVM